MAELDPANLHAAEELACQADCLLVFYGTDTTRADYGVEVFWQDGRFAVRSRQIGKGQMAITVRAHGLGQVLFFTAAEGLACEYAIRKFKPGGWADDFNAIRSFPSAGSADFMVVAAMQGHVLQPEPEHYRLPPPEIAPPF